MLVYFPQEEVQEAGHSLFIFVFDQPLPDAEFLMFSDDQLVVHIDRQLFLEDIIGKFV